MIDKASFTQEISRKANERKHLATLAARYRADLPKIQAQWDLTPGAERHNDIDKTVLAHGMSIYRCCMDDLWRGIYHPNCYDANTIWKPLHAEHKIIRIIEAWETGVTLSPLFLVKHAKLDLALVSDGKHRLTVCRAISALEVPFMVDSTDKKWVEKAIPGASQITY